MSKHPKLTVVIGTSVLLLGILAWIQTGRDASPSELRDPPPPRVPQASSLTRDEKPGVASRVAEAGEAPDLAPATADLAAEEIQAALLEQIHQAAISYEASELPVIEKHLLHGDPLIREAARDGIVTLGAAEGAPLLRKAAALAGDPRESVALLDAADYLELPSADLQKRLRSGKRINEGNKR